MNITPLCGYCGRPVLMAAIYSSGYAYHYECTRGPGAPMTYQAAPLDEARIRQIVRDELARLTAPSPSQQEASP